MGLTWRLQHNFHRAVMNFADVSIHMLQILDPSPLANDALSSIISCRLFFLLPGRQHLVHECVSPTLFFSHGMNLANPIS